MDFDKQKLYKPAIFTAASVAGLFLVKKFGSKKNTGQKREVRCIGLEVGGTGISVAYGIKYLNAKGKVESVEIKNKQYFRTSSSPEKTLDQILEFTKNYEFQHVGIASFGPLCLRKDDAQYGSITSTPKEGWAGFNILGYVKKILKFNGEIGFDTDVNGCAMAEYRLGKYNVKQSLVYVTVGTGVGAGLIINGKPVHGMMHPEGGHMSVPIHLDDFNYEGVCKYHKNCLEGMVTNISIAKRCGLKDVMEVKNLKDDDPVWDRVALYLAYFCVNVAYVCSPEKIILGGGIMKREILYPKIRKNLEALLNGYLVLYKTTVEEFIQAPKLGENVGVIGSMIV